MTKKWEDMTKKEREDYDIGMRQLYGATGRPSTTKKWPPLEAVPRPEANTKPKPRKITLCPTEHEEQVKFVVYLEKAGLLFYSIPNEAKRSRRLAAYMKAQGMKSGCPDICIAEPRGKYHGCYIEMKRKKASQLSENQEWWLRELSKRGYYAIMCKGADEAIDKVQKYLKGDS